MPRDDSEPSGEPMLLAVREKKLHTKAHTEKRFPETHMIADRPDESPLFENFHSLGECADTRKHKRTGTLYIVRRSRNLHTKPLDEEPSPDGFNIADTKIDYRNQGQFLAPRVGAYSTPFVEGMSDEIPVILVAS